LNKKCFSLLEIAIALLVGLTIGSYTANWFNKDTHSMVLLILAIVTGILYTIALVIHNEIKN